MERVKQLLVLRSQAAPVPVPPSATASFTHWVSFVHPAGPPPMQVPPLQLWPPPQSPSEKQATQAHATLSSSGAPAGQSASVSAQAGATQVVVASSQTCPVSSQLVRRWTAL